MDDGPRTGGLQALLVIIGITAAYVAFGSGVWGAVPFMVAAFGAVLWLEHYARRRSRAEEEARRRRLQARAIEHLDFDHDPYDHR